MDDLKKKIIVWLKKRKEEDIVYVKKYPEITIFGRHPGITHYDSTLLIREPEKIISVEISESHDDRLLIVKEYSKKYDTIYIILNPFNKDIEEKFKDKIAIVTIYPSRHN